MNNTKIKIDNEHLKAVIKTKKMENAFLIATAIAQVCERLDEDEKNARDEE